MYPPTLKHATLGCSDNLHTFNEHAFQHVQAVFGEVLP